MALTPLRSLTFWS